jgi:hypothetical protein
MQFHDLLRRFTKRITNPTLDRQPAAVLPRSLPRQRPAPAAESTTYTVPGSSYTYPINIDEQPSGTPGYRWKDLPGYGAAGADDVPGPGIPDVDPGFRGGGSDPGRAFDRAIARLRAAGVEPVSTRLPRLESGDLERPPAGPSPEL